MTADKRLPGEMSAEAVLVLSMDEVVTLIRAMADAAEFKLLGADGCRACRRTGLCTAHRGASQQATRYCQLSKNLIDAAGVLRS